jgi:hypothetical protein
MLLKQGWQSDALNHLSFDKKRIFACFVVGITLFVAACKPRLFNEVSSKESELLDVRSVSFEREQLLGKYRFERITPTGERIMAASLEWERLQESEAARYAKPAQSANNVSRVLEMAGLKDYSSPLMMDMIAAVHRRGGIAVELPKESRAIARFVEEHFEGSLPAGSLVTGCIKRDCSGEAGDGNISIVGHVDGKDQLNLWNNNWFRPENRPWREHMIPLNWYQAGFPRKWMSTPWLNRKRNLVGALTDVGAVLPELGEVNPTDHYVTLTILPEIMSELKQGRSVMSDGMGAVMPFRPHAVTRAASPLPLPPPPPLVDCRKLRTASNIPTNLREEPNGKIICKFPMGTMLERVLNKGVWIEVKGICPNGFQASGVLLAALVVPACEQ